MVGLNSQRLSYAFFALYTLLICALVYFHEPWGDEADAWLIARDQNLLDIFKMMGTAGTPSLWYLIQFPYAKMNFPFETQAVIHTIIAISGAAVFYFNAPFSLLMRTLFLFGYFMGYEYSVIARSYSLSFLLLFSIATLYPKRLEKPLAFGTLLLLLANTNVHSFFLAAAITTIYVYDELRRNRSLAGSFLAVIGVGLALAQLWPPADSQLPGLFSQFKPEMLPRALIHAFLPYMAFLKWKVLWFGIATAGLFVIGLLGFGRATFILLSAYSALTYLFVFKYAGGVRHCGFLLLTLLFCLWIARYEKQYEWGSFLKGLWPKHAVRLKALKYAYALLLVSFVFSVGQAVQFWKFDFEKPFSHAKEVAQYIKDHGLEERKIAAHPPFPAVAVLPYLENVKFYYPGHLGYGTHMTWDKDYVEAMGMPTRAAVNATKITFPRWNHPTKGVILLLDHELENATELGYRLRFKTGSDETPHHRLDQFYLYFPIAQHPHLFG